jgi:hypothetical protein
MCLPTQRRAVQNSYWSCQGVLARAEVRLSVALTMLSYRAPSCFSRRPGGRSYNKSSTGLKQLASIDGLMTSNRSTITPAASEMRSHVSAT